MPYGNGRVYCDADSHIMETFDWVSRFADPAVKDKIPALKLGGAGAEAERAISKAMARVTDAEKTAEIDHNVIEGPKGWYAYGAFDPAERTKALDDLGFSKQMVFSTFAATQYLESKDPDILYGGIRAHNRAITEFCKHDARLIAVGQVSLADPARALDEVREGLRLGCGAFWIPAAPAGEVSPGHPDLDPVWDILSEAGVPFVLHVGAGSRLLLKAYEKNGRPRPTDRLGGGENIRIKDYMVISFGAQMFLSAMVFDGVFERFPALRGGVIELGGGWVPEFLRALDLGHKSFVKSDPNLQLLTLKPSDYIRRAVKFTPFPGEDVGRMMRDAGAELFLFSSDYPHPEGTRDPIGRFEKTFEGVDEAAKDLFYSRNFMEMFGAPALVAAE
ncbi:MAG: amidohydrolase family protein [Phenylobacterium sp.]|uniref:amidohydrolase family protein n=1 Tax=Phenylobacterium sp. TaxID=1871053 RepID=UPI002736AE76|nr:amidohydrolase family protein [Phenylobacterium sp.]MDP3747382.1 amidohydrolase family protein [Phenylobacterium sp.]